MLDVKAIDEGGRMYDNDHFQLHFIEMAKFDSEYKNMNEILKQWLLFMKFGEKEEEFMRYGITMKSFIKQKRNTKSLQ